MGKHSNYEKIKGWKNYYRNSSGKIIFRKTIKGRQRTISTNVDSVREAERIVEERLIDLLSANPEQEKRIKKGILNPLIKDVWPDFTKQRFSGASAATKRSYEGSWKIAISPFWADLTISDINPGVVSNFEAWYLNTHSKRTFFNTRKHLNAFFKYLEKNDTIRKAPPIRKLDDLIVKNTKRKPPGRVYSDDEIQRLLKNAVSERLYLCILIYRYMGARKMEVLSSEKVRWDISEYVAELWSAKNKKWRRVAIPKVVQGPLKKWMGSHDSKYLFPAITNPEKHLDSQYFDDEWKATKKAANISKWDQEDAARIHDLRHTFATQTSRDGWPPLVACQVLDMSLKEYQRTYVHVTDADIRLLMKKSFGGRP